MIIWVCIWHLKLGVVGSPIGPSLQPVESEAVSWQMVPELGWIVGHLAGVWELFDYVGVRLLHRVDLGPRILFSLRVNYNETIGYFFITLTVVISRNNKSLFPYFQVWLSTCHVDGNSRASKKRHVAYLHRRHFEITYGHKRSLTE